jgi:hypothetical protein
MSVAFTRSAASDDVKLDNFANYVRRQTIARFLARYELFRMQLHLKGSIIECGVHHGRGVMTWAKLSSALEPYALDRRIYGFDTFSGFPAIDAKDVPRRAHEAIRTGGFEPAYDVWAELQDVIREYDENRFLNQHQKIFLCRGDAVKTIPAFIEENPHLLISLLFLDFDLYAPTRVALEYFLPRMCRGAVLAFDEVNNPMWPGETQALLESVSLRNYTLRRFTMDPNITYVRL